MITVCFVELDGDEVVDASLRAVTFARRLGGGAPLGCLVLDRPGPGALAQLAAFGVADVRHLDAGDVHGYAPMAAAAALAEMVAPFDDGVDVVAVVAAATDHGNEVLAHLGATTGLELVANCVDAQVQAEVEPGGPGNGGGFAVVRQRWAGSLLEDAVLHARGGLFSVVAEAVTAEPSPVAAEVTVRPIAPALTPLDLAVQAVETRSEGGGVSLASARVVVSGGRGIGGAEGFGVVEELATLLGGAVGVSRAVTSAGWRPHREQVGQTGTRVAPHLYVACGISGAIQHLAGCQGATHMVAINTDPDAPIMARADYAIVGDVSVVLPALVDALRHRTAGS